MILLINDVKAFKREREIMSNDIESPRYGVEQMFDFESYLDQ